MDQSSLKAQFLSAYDAYTNDIFRFIFLKVSSTEVAQDITQEAFMRYWQTLRKSTKASEKIQNERAYLYALARNLIIDWYRKKKESSLDVLTEMGVDFQGEGSTGIIHNAEVTEILALIRKLDAESCEVLMLRFVDGFSPKEIAEQLHESPNTISVRIHRALKEVQRLMHEGNAQQV